MLEPFGPIGLCLVDTKGSDMPAAEHWPERLWLVRHGQSQGNLARDAAQESDAHVIDLDHARRRRALV